MNASTKVFSILSLAYAIGSALSKANNDEFSEKENDSMKWRGEKLSESGAYATGEYQFPDLKDSKVRQIEKKVDQICKHGDSFQIVETLSFILCGVDDIINRTKRKHMKLLAPIVSRALWCQELFDPKLDMDESYSLAAGKYELWDA